jgi:hypothetical protein
MVGTVGNRRTFRIPPSARVRSVALTLPDAATTARVEVRVRAAMGAPDRADCYTLDIGERREGRYWSGANGRGILLTIVRTTTSHTPAPVRPIKPGAATITFGGEPDSGKYHALEVCP